MKRKALLFILSILIFSTCDTTLQPTTHDNPFDRGGDAYQQISATISPLNGAVNIGPGSNIIITFNQAVDPTGWTVIIDGTTYTSGSFDVTGKILTITPSAIFLRNKNITVILDGFKNTSSGSVGEFSYTSLSFTTAQNPTATSSPMSNQTGVAIDSNFVIGFSEAMNQTNSWSVNLNGTVFDKNSPGISWSGNDLTINPSFIYGRSSTVSATLTGFTAAVDNASYAGTSTLSFGTIGLPTAIFSPSNVSTGVSPDSNIVITFSEAMNQTNSWIVNANGTLYDKTSPQISWSGNALTINPASNFTKGSSIVVILSGFTAQLDGGALGGTTTSSFKVPLSVTYNGNGNTGGSVPIDSTDYLIGDTVTVLGNTGNLVKTGYELAGWNTQADGNGTTTPIGGTFSIGTADVLLYALWTRVYALRETGPAGGLIFYDKGSYSNGWRYLEAAPSDVSTNAEWGCTNVTIIGADGAAIGTGNQNTIDIEAVCSTSGTAADLCANYSYGGYSDWFLPSKDELNQIFINLKSYGVGGLGEAIYLSSSEYSSGYAWGQVFGVGNNYGIQYSYNKSFTERVRAIRAF